VRYRLLMLRMMLLIGLMIATAKGTKGVHTALHSTLLMMMMMLLLLRVLLRQRLLLLEPGSICARMILRSLLERSHLLLLWLAIRAEGIEISAAPKSILLRLLLLLMLFTSAKHVLAGLRGLERLLTRCATTEFGNESGIRAINGTAALLLSSRTIKGSVERALLL